MRVPSPVPPIPGAGVASGPTALRRAGAALLAVATAALCLAVGTGWIDALRSWGLVGFGPYVHDALPLRQLAGQGAQPLARVASVWLLTGVMAGWVLRSGRARTRAALLAGAFLVLDVLASDAEYALAHNLRAVHVIEHRGPTAAAIVATACLVAGASLVRIRRR